MNQAKVLIVSLLTVILFSLTVPGNSLAVESFDYASVFSESRQYSSDHYFFPDGHPWANDAPRWFMIALAVTSGDAPYPVTLNSNPTGVKTLTYDGPWLSFPHFSYAAFTAADLGGNYSAPGGAWENRTYSFSAGDATATWTIPAGSLQQLPAIGPVTATGGDHPTFTWNAVAGADAYDVQILNMDQTGAPLFSRPLFASPIIAEDGSLTVSYAYEGELFKQGIDYPVWIRALQYHPLSGSDARYNNQTLNRSTLVMKHRGYVPENLSGWTLEQGGGADFHVDGEDATRFLFNCESTDQTSSEGQIKKHFPNAIGIMADIAVLTATVTANSEWGGMGLGMNVADTPRGTLIAAQIRSEWADGSQRIHCRVRELKADGDAYRDIARVNQHYGWNLSQWVPLGIAVRNNSVVFWAEGRGILTVPLPEDIVMRDDPMRIFMSVDPGALQLNGVVKNVRIPTRDAPLVFDAVKESCDINGDGRIGLEEAIGALQVVSGVSGK